MTVATDELVDVGPAQYEEDVESGAVAYNPAVHGSLGARDAGITRVAGVEWRKDAWCAGDDDEGAWELDPTERTGDYGEVVVELSAADRERVAHARAICAECGVKAQCQALAEESETVPLGIWYGVDWAERGGKVAADNTQRRDKSRANETAAQREARLAKMRAYSARRRRAARA